MILPAYAGRITADELTIGKDQSEINQANQTVAYWKQQVANPIPGQPAAWYILARWVWSDASE